MVEIKIIIDFYLQINLILFFTLISIFDNDNTILMHICFKI